MSQPTVLVGEFSHETNTFVPEPTTRESFRERREYLGAAVVERLRGTNTAVGGAVAVADREGVSLRPTVAASATPGGRVSADAYDHYTGAILDRLDGVDGVFLSLHGAMVPEGMDDGEGPLLEAVRERVGPDVPVVATLDLHTNVTEAMCEAADALVAFESYPHVDMGPTGETGMELLLEALREGTRFETALESPPMLPYAPLQNTRSGPMAAVMKHARALEARDGVAKVSVCPGFHKADVPSVGASVVAVGRDADAAREAARDVATAWWHRREAFVGEFPGPEAAVEEALSVADANDADDGPVVLADTGDNPGGGGAGDTTGLLRAMLDRGATNAGFAIVHDPAAVERCVEAGVGERVTLTLGGNADPDDGAPVEVRDGYVKAVTDGTFVNTGPMGTGTESQFGRTALLYCGDDDGVAVAVTTRRAQPYDAELWRHLGAPPERFDVVAVKSNNHYRAAYEPIASEVVVVNSPGRAAFDPHRYDYEEIRRPVYPLDDMPANAYPE
jgi:microcystin degradation protein MlrC